MGSRNIRIDLLVHEINGLYVELFKLYNQTNNYLGMHIDSDGIVKCYEPDRIEMAKAEIVAMDKRVQEKIQELRDILAEKEKENE